MQLGQRIAKIRKEQGLTQEAFAEKFHVTRQTVSNWENEKSYPDLRTLVKISDMFHISLDVLLKGDSFMVQDIDKKIKKNPLYKGIIIGLVIIVAALFLFIYFNNRSLNDTVKDAIAWSINDIEMIEIYDYESKELVAEYEDRDNIDQLISALDIENWEKAGKISADLSPKYTIEMFHDTKKQDTNNDIEEITVYGNGEYASIFITSPGGAKQNYKTNIDVSNLIDNKN